MTKTTMALLGVLLLFPGTTPLATEVQEGHPPPPFTLKDEHGKAHALEDYIGSPIVIYFTHNMCHYCTQVVAFLKRAHAEYHDDGLVILTINVWADGGEMIRRYREQFDLPFLMLAGKNPQVLRDYEVNYVPIIVFVGRDGLVKELHHHFIMESDFKDGVRAIVEEGAKAPGVPEDAAAPPRGDAGAVRDARGDPGTSGGAR